MKQPKSQAMMFLLGAFLTGGAFGFAADKMMTKRPYTRQFDNRGMREEFANALGLSEAQQVAIDSIFEWRDVQKRELWKRIEPAYKPANDSITDSVRVRINRHLDTTQQRRFKELRDSMTAREQARRPREERR
jgi:hypothetical protein